MTTGQNLQINVVSVILAALGASCLALSGFLLTQEVGEVNRKLPEDRQISYWWWNPERYRRLKNEYKRLYPSGRIHKTAMVVEITGFVFWLLAAIAAGFFR